ncbi:hypothetical protein ZOSMA_3G00250 [Zostera marina]|uniref:Retrotransposon gag domain-containing protein n=1 Tax=Zostera marina TaxID=29655 RepID=A0A0K9P3J2_ZOSMR|nr:hypothetical protein ZOSMA_3G00250 [Zostera marina]
MNWYVNLPQGSISNFEELHHKFLEAFNHLVKRKTNQCALLNVRQKTNETLREYVKRFVETLNRVERPSDSASIMAFKAGLRPTRFAVKITKDPPADIADLFEKAYSAMDVEEMLEEKYKEFKIPTTTSPQNKIIFNQAKPKENQRDKFLELQNILPPPKPMSEATTQVRSNGKYCEYHKDKGHTTKDCRVLAKVLAEHDKTNLPQVNLINKPGPSKTIFVIWSNPVAKRNLEVFTINQSMKRIKLN